jgi:hypothetical protein
MSEGRQNSENKNKRVFKPSTNNNLRQAQAHQLQREIDKLALLLYQTKKQSDKIQALADAMGDAVFANVEAQLASLGRRKRPTAVNGKPARLRSRTDKTFPLLSEPSQLQQARP